MTDDELETGSYDEHGVAVEMIETSAQILIAAPSPRIRESLCLLLHALLQPCRVIAVEQVDVFVLKNPDIRPELVILANNSPISEQSATIRMVKMGFNNPFCLALRDPEDDTRLHGLNGTISTGSTGQELLAVVEAALQKQRKRS